MVEGDGKNLAFIFSTPRAGSTLLGAMLGGHSQVLCPNEPWFLLPLASMHDQRMGAVAAFDLYLARIGFNELTPAGEFHTAARHFAAELYNQRLAAEGRSVFIDKTPRYYQILPFIQTLFPAAKKIWLKRDLFDTAASYRNTWNIGLDELFGPKTTNYSFDLTLGPANLHDFFDAHPGFEVRYEDLVEAPDEIAAQLCDYLEIPRERDLALYARDQSWIGKLKSRVMGDKKIFSHTSPHKQSVGAWERTFVTEEVKSIVDRIDERLLVRMGYGERVGQLRGRGFVFPGKKEADQILDDYRKLIVSHHWPYWSQLPPPPRPPAVPPPWWRAFAMKCGLTQAPVE